MARSAMITLLVAVAAVTAALAAAPADAAGVPTTVMIFDDKLVSKTTVTWKTHITYKGKALTTEHDQTLTTKEGQYAYKVPEAHSCGAIRATTTIGGIQSHKSDHGKCSRPALNLLSARTTGVGLAYCARLNERKCVKRLFWTDCKCVGSSHIRVAVIDDEGNFMSLTAGGAFRACGKLYNTELEAAFKAGAKRPH